jgi:uncharacterized membrane protein
MDTAIASMPPALGVALLALVFVGTHVGLATHGVRGRLVARLGEGGFFGVYFSVASATFALLVAYYAAHRFDGAPGLALGAHPLVRAMLIATIVAGIALSVAGLAAYPRMPVALFGRSVGEPRGIERITRHPFFAGTALLTVAHALLATHLTGTVMMSALALLAIAGARHQDAKHLRRHGQPYADYLAATSLVPFAAIVAGRQRLAWREQSLGALAAGVVVALALRAVHAGLFAGGGRWIVVAVVGGGVLASVQSWRRVRRRSARPIATAPSFAKAVRR